MNSPSLPRLILGLFALTAPLHAGQQIAPAPDKSAIVEPAEDKLPPGTLTLGGKFSDDLQSGYLDSVAPFWAPGDFLFFLNTRTTIADNSQTMGSYGLGVRYLVPGQEIILGANVFYDSIESQFSNHFDQLGVGFEVLTRWFDARINWYLPDNSTYETGRSSSTDRSERTSGAFIDGNEIKQRTTSDTRRTDYKRYETALEGFNLEGGFLVPGLDKYLELRLLAGYYQYESGFGQDYEGFKARAEARFLPGVIGDLEYWDDAALVGGHWVAGVRVSVPFSIFNLFSGRNPFEGASESFTPRKREFSERLGEMVIRSHRIFTTDSGPQNSGTSESREVSEQVVGEVPVTPTPAPPIEQPCA